jgi:hypothetical protein
MHDDYRMFHDDFLAMFVMTLATVVSMVSAIRNKTAAGGEQTESAGE